MTPAEIQLGDVIRIKHGFAFKGEYFSDAGNYILLTPGNCYERGGLKLKGTKEKYYVGDIPEDYILSSGDLIVVMTDLVNSAPILGGAFFIPEDDKFLHNQRLGLVEVVDNKKMDRDYLFYVLNSEPYRGQVRGSATGATVRHTAPERIYRVRVRVPDISTQKVIAGTLKSYDDLIANNRRRIELLERSARLLFKEWFVRLRYPGHEHDKVTDRVPKGWQIKRIEEIADTIGGGTPSSNVSKFWDNGDITWFVPSDVTKNNCLVLLDSERKITEEGLRSSSARMLPRGAILMTSRASVGFFGLYDEGDCCTNQGFITIAPRVSCARYFMLQNLLYRREEIISKAGGATYKEINKTTFRNLTMVIPAESIRREFENICSSLFAQVRTLKKQSAKAEKARDLLLPRLMDGRIAV